MDNLFSPSEDYRKMLPYWQQVRDLGDGVAGLRRNPARYLPQYPAESDEGWAYRNSISKLTDVFSDVCESLSGKPFSREAALVEGSYSEPMERLAEDATALGDHLSIFAQDVFQSGIEYAVAWVLVDYTGDGSAENAVEERRQAARPYFRRIDVMDLIHVESAMVQNMERITDARIREDYKNDQGEVVQRIRRLWHEPGADSPVVQVWDKVKGTPELVCEHTLGLPYIPLVYFATGRRIPGTWRFTLPMRAIADLQIEHYQQETNLKLTKQVVGSPMLTAEGISPPLDAAGNPMRLTTGPNTVLWAEPDEEGRYGKWGMLQIDAGGLKFLAEEIKEAESQMRELGRQPLTGGTAGLTQVAAAFASQRASSALQAWTFHLKDSLEQCFRAAAEWVGLSEEPKVSIYTDFAIAVGDEKTPELLLKMAEPDIDTGAPMISRRTLFHELQRRGILSEEFDMEKNQEEILEELGVDIDEGEDE